MRYTYLGDRLTRPELKGMQCNPVRDLRDKCVLSHIKATALVVDAKGVMYIVARRRLRLNAKATRPQTENEPNQGEAQTNAGTQTGQ